METGPPYATLTRSNRQGEICVRLNAVLADCFILYLRTKGFHWHMTGPHFRDYHLLLDDHSSQVFAMTDVLAERVRKLGGGTLRSIADVQRHGSLLNGHVGTSDAAGMLAQMRDDNAKLAESLREAHALCGDEGDVASTSVLEQFIDEAEGRIWFLSEMV